MSGDQTCDVRVKEAIRKVYGGAADQNNKSDRRDVEYSCQLGYSEDDFKGIPAGANMALGCGNPVAEARLKPGEAVLDLGSGGGFDCFLSAKNVGPSGFVIGVDMLPVMIDKSRANLRESSFKNIEFRLGEIEALPIADKIIDVAISNCVINLSTDKPRVFREVARVLKPGGRICISDMVATAPMPESVKQDLALKAACVAGALGVEEIKKLLLDIGFEDVEVIVKESSRMFIEKWMTASETQKYVASAIIKAKRSMYN